MEEAKQICMETSLRAEQTLATATLIWCDAAEDAGAPIWAE